MWVGGKKGDNGSFASRNLLYVEKRTVDSILSRWLTVGYENCVDPPAHWRSGSFYPPSSPLTAVASTRQPASFLTLNLSWNLHPPAIWWKLLEQIIWTASSYRKSDYSKHSCTNQTLPNSQGAQEIDYIISNRSTLFCPVYLVYIFHSYHFFRCIKYNSELFV